MYIRDVCSDDLPVLQDIEVAAGRLFHEVSMPEIANDPPPSVERLAEHQRAGLAWVVTDDETGPAGYLVADEVDGNLHIEQLSVLPSHGRRGLGRTLIARAEREAADRGLPAVTLTTFLSVPWNAPYYLRCGFEVIGRERETAGLRRIRAQEAEAGLDQWPRVCMRKAVVRA
ncbi:GNAT family N-acetyltransferase [Gordonia caeni]|uniref:GNAT family N-acetyltransferase n=1 Tax=Gordonia caeni TaxID=1007097 RepID=A0ABP7P2M2_9ACTN